MDDAPDEHILNRFTKAIINNVSQSMSKIDPEVFAAACDLLSDPKRRVFVVGGRITRTLADYFFLHLQVIRDDMVHIASSSNAWPHYLLNFKPGDVVVIFDIRHYENGTLKLAGMARERGAKIILLTDQWISLVAEHTAQVLTHHIEAPSAWDSNITVLLTAEMIIAEVPERN